MGDGTGHGMIRRRKDPQWEEIFEFAGFDLPLPMAMLWREFLKEYRYSQRYRWGGSYDPNLRICYRNMRQSLAALRKLGLRNIPDPSGYYKALLRGLLEENEAENHPRLAELFFRLMGDWVDEEEVRKELSI